MSVGSNVRDRPADRRRDTPKKASLSSTASSAGRFYATSIDSIREKKRNKQNAMLLSTILLSLENRFIVKKTSKRAKV